MSALTTIIKKLSSQGQRNKQMVDEIRAEIISVTKRLDLENEASNGAYVCTNDLKRIWQDGSRISAVLHTTSLSDKQLRCIQERMIIILSTLFWIGANDCLSNFTVRLFDSLGEPLVTDDNVPLEKDKIYFLGLERQNQFYDSQFRFKPVVILLKPTQFTQVLHPKERLPFEICQEDVGAGGYGKVDRVGISPRYIKRASGGWDTPEVFWLACKKFVVHKDFATEKENLQILKESLTSHARIMKHLTTIEHGQHRYILLPFARYGDLEVFLHGGKAPDGQTKYDLNTFFPDLKNMDLTLPLLSECTKLAHALGWLHTQVKIEKTSRTLVGAHMDLKPANILIYEGDSVVGRWMISDFGISVFKEETHQPDPEIVSIGDYYSQMTMNTRPKRQTGTYQAPEVRIAHSIFGQYTHLTPDQRGIGRKSDIWSFGCILSEILAFSVGKDDLVRKFQMARLRNSIDDYFYTERTDHNQRYLSAADAPKEYEVRPSVISWLDNLCQKTANPQKWVDCYVGTILKILVVDTEQRPDASRLMGLLDHITEHIKASPYSASVVCPIIDPPEEMVVSGGSLLQQGPDGPAPLRPLSPTPQSPIKHPGTNQATSSGSEAGDGTDLQQSLPQHSVFAKPIHNHGLMVDPIVPMILDPTSSIFHPLKPQTTPQTTNLKIVSLAMTVSSKGIRVACLSVSSVYTYILAAESTPATFEEEITLGSPNAWKGIALAGNFLAVWGFSTEKLLHFCDVKKLQPSRHFSPQQISMLQTVSVSKQGIIALSCRYKYGSRIIVAKLDAEEEPTTLTELSDQIFTDIAFNDNGEKLYAWAYGQHDSLYVWRFREGVIDPKTESECHYETEKKGEPDNSKVLPYSTHLGCIIATPNKRFFPARVIHSSLSGDGKILPRTNEIPLFGVQAACVFNDHSMITVERRMIHNYLREHKIDYKGTHPFISQGESICRVKSRVNNSSKIMVVKEENNIVVIVCNTDSTVEFIKFTGSRK